MLRTEGCFAVKLEFECYFALPQSNQKAVKENLDNPENVPDIDIRYFTRSYFACHRRSCTYTARNITSVALVESYRDAEQHHWHHPKLRFGIHQKADLVSLPHRGLAVRNMGFGQLFKSKSAFWWIVDIQIIVGRSKPLSYKIDGYRCVTSHGTTHRLSPTTYSIWIAEICRGGVPRPHVHLPHKL